MKKTEADKKADEAFDDWSTKLKQLNTTENLLADIQDKREKLNALPDELKGTEHFRRAEQELTNEEDKLKQSQSKAENLKIGSER